MTNGEKIQQVFPDAKVVSTNSIHMIGLKPAGQSRNWIVWFDKDWWSSEYKDYEKSKSGSWSERYHEGFQTGVELGKAFSRPQGEWIDYDNTFYKCPDCGYLLEKCCPQCQTKVILPKGGAE